jgi:hypothetical protein
MNRFIKRSGLGFISSLPVEFQKMFDEGIQETVILAGLRSVGFVGLDLHGALCLLEIVRTVVE